MIGGGVEGFELQITHHKLTQRLLRFVLHRYTGPEAIRTGGRRLISNRLLASVGV